MGRWTIVGCALAMSALAALPAIAGADKKKKDGPVLRLAHTYEAAVAEAKERNCVLFVSLHGDH